MTKTLSEKLKDDIELIDSPARLLGMYKGILTRNDLNELEKKYLEGNVFIIMNRLYYGKKQ